MLCWAESEKLLSEPDWTGREPRQKSPRDVSRERTSYSGKKTLPCAISYSYFNKPPSTPVSDCQGCDDFPRFPNMQFRGLGSSAKVISPRAPPLLSSSSSSSETQRTFEACKIETITGDDSNKKNLIFLTDRTHFLFRYKMSNTNKYSHDEARFFSWLLCVVNLFLRAVRKPCACHYRLLNINKPVCSGSVLLIHDPYPEINEQLGFHKYHLTKSVLLL